jgi:hypothetical protein
MSPSGPLIPADPAEDLTLDDAPDDWREQTDPGLSPEPSGEPPKAPPPWVPPDAPEPAPAEPPPLPDWSPSGGEIVPPIIDPPQNPTEHPGPAAGAHGMDDFRVESREDPDGGDPEDPGAEMPFASL